jgi:DNA modification methylase
MRLNTIYQGDAFNILKLLPDKFVHCVVTSPPYYGLRDYGIVNQIGLEKSLQEYIDRLTIVFMEVYRILKDRGTLWLNLGDSYASTTKGSGGENNKAGLFHRGQGKNSGSFFNIRKFDLNISGVKPKDLFGVPWRMALALQSQGWFLRNDIIWEKPNVMPTSARDRCTLSHEYVFLLTKDSKYYCNMGKIRESSVQEFGDVLYGKNRNRRTVWRLNKETIRDTHFATFPRKLVELCILAGTPKNGIVLDPFMGSGTTALVAKSLQRNFVGIELNTKYIKLAKKRLQS